MRYELRDYQRDAATRDAEAPRARSRGTGASTERARRSRSRPSPGSGKTVIATAVIEALLFGSTDLDADADPRVAFLWITDDPALNRQTRARMFDASELLAPTTLVEVDESFLDADLAPGRVYFLNTQKLSKSSRLAQGGTNAREFSFWDVLRATIRGGATDLVMVLDEAHRGMKRAADRKTIVARLIHGEPGSNPPIPIVWGISATIERFTTAMGEVTDRTGYPNVAVDIERVRASGLIKDEIGLDQPDEKGTFSTTLLREAVKATLAFEQRWAAYSAAEAEPEVLPVLVVQVPDKASEAKLAERRRHDRGGVAGPRPAGDRPRPGRARAPLAGLAHGRLGLPGVDPDRHRRARGPRQGGDLDRVGLPAGGGPLLGAAGEGRDAHRPDHRPHGPPAARPPDRHRRRPQLGHLLPAAVRHEGAHRASSRSWRARAPGTGRTGSARA